jgi:hypothetical protein
MLKNKSYIFSTLTFEKSSSEKLYLVPVLHFVREKNLKGILCGTENINNHFDLVFNILSTLL